MNPKEITQCVNTGVNVASFSFYEGVKEVEHRKLERTTTFSDVNKYTHYLVCCGDVMFRVKETEYPDVNRRIF